MAYYINKGIEVKMFVICLKSADISLPTFKKQRKEYYGG